MKTIFSFFVLFVPFFLGGQNAPEFSIYSIAPELLEQANEVVRLEDRFVKVESEEKISYRCRKVVSILSQDSNAGTQPVFYNSDSKIKKINAVIYDALGNEIRRLSKNDIADYSAVSGFSLYEDNRVKIVEANQSQYPFTLEIEYEMTMTGTLYISALDWMIQQLNQSVEKGIYTLETPASLEFLYEAVNIELEPVITTSKDSRTYRWEVAQLQAIQQERFSPPFGDIIPQLKVSPAEFKIEGYAGGMRSWEDFSRFMYTLFKGRDAIPPSLQLEIRKLAGQETDNRKKIELLYQLLQKKNRYVSVQLGIGGWQPFDVEYVHKNQYGDCKALTNFMMAMLKEVDIESYPVLIFNNQEPYNPIQSFANPQFNHVILYVPEEDLFLECTSSSYPVNFIGSGNESRQGLLVSENGGRLIDIPATPHDQNRIHHQYDILLQPDGSSQLKGTIDYQGIPHSLLRSMENRYSQEEKENYILETLDLPAFSIQQLQLQSDDHQPSASMAFEYQVYKYATKAGKRLFIPINRLNPQTFVPAIDENRIHDLQIREGRIEEDEVRIFLPSGYKVESIPEKKSRVESLFGTFETELLQKEDHLLYKRSFELRPGRYPAEDFSKFRDWLKEVAKKDKKKLVLVEQRA